jgi:hypothetical protein
MSVKLPTIGPDAPAEKPVENKPVENTTAENKAAENKFDRFRPEMPQIPGVGQNARRGPTGLDSQRLLLIGGVVAAVVLIGAILLWRARSKPDARANPISNAESAEPLAPVPALPNPAAPAFDGTTVAATVEELSKPWAAKQFTFVKPFTRENIPAMVIRLPGGGLWAFSRQGPFGSCELEFVTDLGTLATQYKYKAGHPMVVSPCNGTVYDPLKIGALGGDTWARGEIVQGSSLRPPISIDVKVRGRSIVADGIE